MAAMSLASAFTLLFALTYALAGHSLREVALQPTNTTLEHLLCNSTLEKATTIILEPNVTYTISGNKFCVVENLTSLTIRGKSQEDLAMIQCSPTSNISSGFGFVNIVDEVIIENVYVENCGGVITPTAVRGVNDSYCYFGNGQTAVFLFSLCFDLQLKNIVITNYTGYAVVGVNVFSQDEDAVLIRNVNITNSSYFGRLTPEGTYSYVGSGMLLYYLDTMHEVRAQPYPNSTTLEISGCTFSKNMNHANIFAPTVVKAINDPRVKRLPFSGGGALSIICTQNTTTLTTNVSSSLFTLNGGQLYGAVFVLFLSTPSSSTVHFDHCHFESGFSFANKYSGNDIAVYFNFTYPLSSNNAGRECLRIEHANFVIGHTSYVQKHAHIALIQLSNVAATCNAVLKDVDFRKNSPLAVAMYGCLFAFSLGTANNLNIEMIDVNSAMKHGAFKFINLGRVRIKGTTLGSSVFEGATTSLMDVYASDLYLSGNITFRNNQAEHGSGGGAILLQAESRLYFEEPVEVVFANNYATYGGAIYAVESNAPFCTFQYMTDGNVTCNKTKCSRDLKINITFVDNTAELAGNSIYVDPLYHCDLILTSSLFVDAQYLPNLYDNIFHFTNSSSNHLPQMSSTAREICFCNASNVGERCNNTSNFIPNITTYSGKDFSVSMQPLDSGGKPVYSIVNSVLTLCNDSSTPDHAWALPSNETVIQILGLGCTKVVYRINAEHEVSEARNVCLSVQPIRMRTIVPSEDTSKQFHVLMKRCPLGFEYSLDDGCTCNKLLSRHHVECHSDRGLVTMPTDSWVGPVDHEKVGFSKSCPEGYCNTNTEMVDISDPTSCCAHKRTGILCGNCQDKLSVVFGSTECKSCTSLWLLSICLYALAGVGLVIVLFLLRMTVADGVVNGLVFYANVLSTNIMIFLDHKSLIWLLRFISLINLDLGFPICFYHGMSEVAKAYLQFVFPVYLWSITGIVILISRYSLTVSRLSSSYSVPVLATLIFLSYSKLLRAAIVGLVSADVDVESINGTTHTMSVWYFDGTLEYCTGSHIGLFILSLVTLLFFVIPYTVGLTGAPFLIRFRIVNYFKPMIDAYTGPYKDKQQFWFGARLCVLIVILSSYAILKGRNDSLLLYIETLILALCLYAQALVNPYRNKLVYILDTFFLVDCFLLTSYGTFLHTTDEHLYIGAGILVSLVFIVTCVIVASYIWLRLPFKFRMLKKKREVSFISNDVSASTSDYGTIVGSSIYSSNKCREPLLEDY